MQSRRVVSGQVFAHNGQQWDGDLCSANRCQGRVGQSTLDDVHFNSALYHNKQLDNQQLLYQHFIDWIFGD